MCIICCLSCNIKPNEASLSDNNSEMNKGAEQLIEVNKALEPIVLDGEGNETSWHQSKWHPIDQLWLGEAYDTLDFAGRYKLSWDAEALFALVEIQDDSLFDQYQDPLKLWWDDDCVEIFIDEDQSGGNHQYNHNAFAYHVALDGNVVDIAPGDVPTLYNDHVISKRKTQDNISIWELKIYLFDDSFKDGEENTPVKLNAGKKIGFALAYCDNDGSAERENFIGSVPVEGEDKNRGWIDASIFGNLRLVD